MAESTGLLAVNDEVLEVNGIEVAGKSLDQVIVIMVALVFYIMLVIMISVLQDDLGEQQSIRFFHTTFFLIHVYLRVFNALSCEV